MIYFFKIILFLHSKNYTKLFYLLLIDGVTDGGLVPWYVHLASLFVIPSVSVTLIIYIKAP